MKPDRGDEGDNEAMKTFDEIEVRRTGLTQGGGMAVSGQRVLEAERRLSSGLGTEL